MDSLLSEVVPVDDESRPARPLLLAACGLTQIPTLRVAVPPKTVGRKRARTVLATLVLAMFRQSKNGSRTRRFSPPPAHRGRKTTGYQYFGSFIQDSQDTSGDTI